MSGASFISKEERGLVADLAEWAQQQPAIGRCSFCPDWIATGTIKEIRELAKAHRRVSHPEIPTRKRRPPRPNLVKWRTTLDEDQTLEIRQERKRRMRQLGIEEPSEEGSSS